MTKYDFLRKSFASYNQQMQKMLETQCEIVDALCKLDQKDTPDNAYSDIKSDGGLDPRTKYEAERFKRQWVGLTDEEMEQVYSSIYGAGTEHENLIEMGRATEAKLKEKNGW